MSTQSDLLKMDDDQLRDELSNRCIRSPEKLDKLLADLGIIPPAAADFANSSQPAVDAVLAAGKREAIRAAYRDDYDPTERERAEWDQQNAGDRFE